MTIKLLKLSILLCVVGLSCLQKSPVFSSESELLIVELRTQSELSGTDEKVIIFNNSEQTMNLSRVVLQYRSASGSAWQNRAILEGELEAHAKKVLSTDDQSLKSGMSSTGGHMRIYDIDKQIEYDLLGWGTAKFAKTNPAPAHGKNGGLKRKTAPDGYQNTGVNFDDFEDTTIILEEGGSTDDTLDSSIYRQTELAKNYPAIHVTEIMPDPAAPFSDKDDEFVELFNPNATGVNLQNYALKLSSGKSFVLPAHWLASGGYFAVYSEDSSLNMTNSSSGFVEVLAPNGKVLSKTASYQKAQSGESFMLDSAGVWVWTARPTPSKPNKFVANDTGQVDTAEQGKVLSAQDRDYNQNGRDIYQSAPSEVASATNYWVIGVVGGFGFLYVLYEYRQDVADKLSVVRKYMRAKLEKTRAKS